MKFWAIPITSAFALAAVAVTAFLLSGKAHSGVAAPADKAKVLVQEMKLTEDTQRLLVPAKVEARVASLVTADVEGFVTEIKQPLGSRVKAGQVVLYIENKDPAYTYAKVPVRSPVTGVVSQLQATLMTRVAHGDKLFMVIVPKDLKLTAEIPGSDLALVQPGSKGTFLQNLDDPKGVPIKVLGVSPLVDPRTGTASAELSFAPAKGDSLPAIGSVGHALFEKSQGKVLLIPESALGYDDGKPMVRVLEATGTVKRKTVELGEQKESLLVVKSGLSAGDKLILRANRSVKDGEAVDVEPAKN